MSRKKKINCILAGPLQIQESGADADITITIYVQFKEMITS